MNPHDVVDIELTGSERRLLTSGLSEWGGPARCTEEMAIALGFKSVGDIFVVGKRVRDTLEAGGSLTGLDWLRTLLATEVAFASDVVGSGSDWSITTGI